MTQPIAWAVTVERAYRPFAFEIGGEIATAPKVSEPSILIVSYAVPTGYELPGLNPHATVPSIVADPETCTNK